MRSDHDKIKQPRMANLFCCLNAGYARKNNWRQFCMILIGHRVHENTKIKREIFPSKSSGLVPQENTCSNRFLYFINSWKVWSNCLNAKKTKIVVYRALFLRYIADMIRCIGNILQIFRDTVRGKAIIWRGIRAFLRYSLILDRQYIVQAKYPCQSVMLLIEGCVPVTVHRSDRNSPPRFVRAKYKYPQLYLFKVDEHNILLPLSAQQPYVEGYKKATPAYSILWEFRISENINKVRHSKKLIKIIGNAVKVKRFLNDNSNTWIRNNLKSFFSSNLVSTTKMLILKTRM